MSAKQEYYGKWMLDKSDSYFSIQSKLRFSDRMGSSHSLCLTVTTWFLSKDYKAQLIPMDHTGLLLCKYFSHISQEWNNLSIRRKLPQVLNPRVPSSLPVYHDSDTILYSLTALQMVNNSWLNASPLSNIKLLLPRWCLSPSNRFLACWMEFTLLRQLST